MLTSKCLEEFQPGSRAQTGGPEPRGGWFGWVARRRRRGGVAEGLDISRIYDTRRSFESQQQNIKIDTGVTQEPLELFGRGGVGGVVVCG